MADIVAVQIKEEPLDRDEVVCMLGQIADQKDKQGMEYTSLHLSNIERNHILNTMIKTEPQEAVDNDDDDDNEEEDEVRLHIIDEQQPDIITVDVSSLRDDNERKFLEKLTLSTQTTTCKKCQHIFYTTGEYKRHISENMCRKAPNIFPCAKFCGRYFKTPEECQLHEDEDHKISTKIQNNNNIKESTPNVRYKLKSRKYFYKFY